MTWPGRADVSLDGCVALDAIADAHGRWKAGDGSRLGIDRLEVYERVRN